MLGVVALIDLALGWATRPLADALGGPLELRRVLGWLFTPLAWLIGIEPADVAEAARLLGARAVVTEVPAYRELGRLAAEDAVSPRTTL